MSMSTVFFPCRAGLWDSLPIDSFPLTYDLSGFKSRINRHHLTVRSFLKDFQYALIFCASFSCNSMPRSGSSALHGVNLNLKKIFSFLAYQRIVQILYETRDTLIEALTVLRVRQP